MSAYSQKVIRGFWQERARTVCVALAIAIGISAFSAVLSSYAILTRELDKGYLETNPASATLRTDRLYRIPPFPRPRKAVWFSQGAKIHATVTSALRWIAAADP